MNIIIPMAGLGARFPKDRYPFPKPLIPIHGVPMIKLAVQSLRIEGTYHFVVLRKDSTPLLTQVLSDTSKDSRVYIIDALTDGPARTALVAATSIESDDELIITNCDQIMEWNSRTFLHNTSLYDSTIVTYHANTPHNSYAVLNRAGYVSNVREKQIISNISLNGIHYWRKARYFVDSALEMIKQNDTAPNGEFYISHTFNHLIASGRSVGIYHIPNQQHHAVGTPADLEVYLARTGL